MDDLGAGCTTHHAACACGEARHQAELAALRLELDAERAVSASLREQLALLADRTLSGDLLAAFKEAVSRAPSAASDPQPQEGVTFFRGSGKAPAPTDSVGDFPMGPGWGVLRSGAGEGE